MLGFLDTYAILFGFVLVRIAAILSMLPLWSGRMPAMWKVGSIVWMSLIFVFLLPPAAVPRTLTTGALVVGLFREVMLGALLGFATRLFMGGVMLAGQLTGFQMGLAIANVVDPVTSQQGSVVAQLLNLLLLLLLLELDGHLLAVRMVARSFEVLPPFSAHLTGPLFSELVLEGGRRMFETGLEIAWPMSVALLLVYTSMGLLNRLAPQMNMMMLGFPLTITVGFLTLLLYLSPLMVRFERLIEEMFLSLDQLLLAMRG